MKRFNGVAILLLRVLIGVLFLFSGFVKGVDPLGSAYKFSDYLGIIGLGHWYWISIFLSVILSLAEFMIGIALIFKIFPKFTTWLALVFMAFFTILTFLLAVFNPITDCGCFGDALKMTNWQTFWKNTVFIVIVSYLFYYRKKIKPTIKRKSQWAITWVGIVGFGILTWYCLVYLPIIDFRPYKVGSHLPSQMKTPEGATSDIYEQYFTLEDTLNKKKIEILSTEYLSDSTYWHPSTNWKFVSSSEPRLVKKGYEPPIHGFSINSPEGDDITESVLSDPSDVYLLIAYNLDKASGAGLAKANQIAKYCDSTSLCSFYAITASPDKAKEIAILSNDLVYQFQSCDEIALKTIIRSNPGIVKLKQGTVVAKWNYRDFPDRFFEAGSDFKQTRLKTEWAMSVSFFALLSLALLLFYWPKKK